MDEEINLTELVPVMRPGTRGLFHIGSLAVKRMGHGGLLAYRQLLDEAAEKAGVHLTKKVANRILMIGWTPK